MEANSVLLVDNFSAHTSAESFNTVKDELMSELVPLPPNTTSVCQPLDVGIMGPFKAKIRALWLRDTKKYTTQPPKRMAVSKRAIAAWDGISQEAVKSAFIKAIPQTNA